MDFQDLSQALHVISRGGNGGVESLKVALNLGSDQVLMNEDPIDIGPAPATNDLGLWRSIRERFIRNIKIERPDFSFDDFARNGLLMNADRLGKEAPVVVWIAHGLSEQLLLAWVAFLFDHQELDLSKLYIVQFEQRHSGQRIPGIGDLAPENIRELCPEPRQLNSEEVEELRRAWRVYTSSDTSDLAQYTAGTSPMPLLHQAISRLVYRYPDLRSGIGIWDEKLLSHTRGEGSKAAHVIGSTMVCDEFKLDLVGDGHLFSRLTAMGSEDQASPLVSFTGGTQTIRECTVIPTPFGERVLAGEANHVEANGIDDWVGGVHLSSAEGNVTFRDGGSLILPQ